MDNRTASHIAEPDEADGREEERVRMDARECTHEHRLAFGLCLWVFSLVCAPFFIARQRNPALSGRHILVGFGLVVGALITHALIVRGLLMHGPVTRGTTTHAPSASAPTTHGHQDPRSHSLWARLSRPQTHAILLIAGIVLTTLSVGPEWLLYPLGIQGERLDPFFGSELYNVLDHRFAAFQSPALLLSSLLCGYACAREHALDEHTGSGCANAQPTPSGNIWDVLIAPASIGALQASLLLGLAQLLYNQPFNPLGMLACEGVPLALSLSAYALLYIRPKLPIWATLPALCAGGAVPQLLTRVLKNIPTWQVAQWAFLIAAACGLILSLWRSARLIHTGTTADKAKADGPTRTQDAPAANGSAKAGCATGGPTASAGAVAARLAPYALAPRELEIATAFATGESSPRIAERLGIKPSTVRATLQRVYKKTGTAGKVELTRLVGLPDASRPTLPSRAPENGAITGDTIGTPNGNIPVRILACALCSCLTLVPLGFQGLSWGAARPLIYGVSFGLIGLGLYAGMCLGAEARPFPASPRCRRSSQDGALPKRDRPSADRHAEKPSALLAILGAVSLVTAILAGPRLGLLDDSATLLVAFLGILLVGAPFLRAVRTSISAQDSTKLAAGPSGPVVTAVVPVLTFGLGYYWEEAWRGTVWFSLAGHLTPLCLIGSFVLPLMLWRQHHPARAVLTVALIVTSAAARLSSVLLICYTLGLVTLVRIAARHGHIGWGTLSCAIAAGGLGALAGDYLVNLIGFYLVGNLSFTAPYGGRAAFRALATGSTLLVSAFAGLCAPLSFIAMSSDDTFAASCAVGADGLARAEHVLLGYGLNDTQVKVALGILVGQSSAEIAQAHHYALGTVNAARDSVYKTLGVHDRFALSQLFQQVNDV